MTRLRNWWFRPAPVARIAVLRVLVYLYVPWDMLTRTAQVVPHAYGSAALYDPVDLLIWIHQPSPEPWFAKTLRVVVIASSLVAATTLSTRIAGWITAVGFLDWSSIAMSYGKIDHDHLALVVALFVLPTVGRSTLRPVPSEAAGWALRCVELAIVATYFLASYAKLVRYGRPHWLTGATFAWAVVRRGSSLARPLLHHPLLLVLAQFAICGMEVATPLLLIAGRRVRILGFVVLVSFHVVTYLMIGIDFAPLIVCLTVLLPLEDVVWRASKLLPDRLAIPSYP